MELESNESAVVLVGLAGSANHFLARVWSVAELRGRAIGVPVAVPLNAPG